jgi:acyl-CoA thioesterase I
VPKSPARPGCGSSSSLTAGYGLPEEQAFPALLEARAALAGRPFRSVNAGVSGDTSRGGLARLDWLLRQSPDLVVVGLGANDGLRGLSIEQLEANLVAILEKIEAAGAEALLLGQRLPPSMGEYARDFHAVYTRVAEERGVELVPFLLEGVGGERALNLPDGIHPNRRGQERLADNVWPKLSRMLERLEQ